jgi:hypothetical protein
MKSAVSLYQMDASPSNESSANMLIKRIARIHRILGSQVRMEERLIVHLMLRKRYKDY